VSRYWRIYRTFFTSSLTRELEFRANFFAKIGQNAVWITFFVLILLVVFSRTATVAGWNRGDAFVLAATCFVMNALAGAFTMSLMEIPQQVRQGTLDFVLTKPVNSQFWVSLRRFSFDHIGSFLAGAAMVGVGVVQAGAHPSVFQWMGYSILVLASLLIYYSFNLFLMTLGIWWVRVENLWVLGESVMQVARFPVDIFGRPIARFLTVIVPLAFFATIPAQQLVRGLDWGMVALGVLWAVLAMVLGAFFWRFALRSYASASS
jgi:ABC-2 type transport system permease protein